MDPRKFLAAIQCNDCDLMTYTLRDATQHCSYHATVDLICHHCLVHYNSKAAIAAHMNQNNAHLRPPYDPNTYFTAMPSPASSSASAVLPLTQPVLQPTPSSPIPPVATLADVSLDQLLRDINTSTTAGTDVSASSAQSISPPFYPQAASSQPHSFSSPDASPTVGARPTTTNSYPPAEYRRLRQRNTEYKFLLWWCLHHLKSLPTPPPSAGGELDLALRRVLQQTAIALPQFDENSSFQDIVTKCHDMHVQTVTKFP